MKRSRTRLRKLHISFPGIRLTLKVMVCFNVVILAFIVCMAGCGNKSTNGEAAKEFSLEEDLGNFQNSLQFEIIEPMHTVITGKVLKVQENGPFDLVLVEIGESHTPPGIKDDLYEGKVIAQGTRLVLEWMNGTSAEVGREYALPVEITPAVRGLRVVLQGLPREIPPQEKRAEGM
jgi:hypothetical protein